ncbi:MAG: hypothetical protein HY337_07050 [Gemmatimonadetes bacterium]|nr:hypothetical protein [Gemmatimonadota bacterium]
MSRPHPFDLVFGELARTRFAEIRAADAAKLDVRHSVSEQPEAQASDIGHRTSPTSRDRRLFLQLPAVQGLLADIAPGEGVPNRGAQMEEYGILLYVIYHYWNRGERTVAVSLEELDAAAATAADRSPTVPDGACYLRLPEHRYWAQVAPDAPHEPLDGCFVVIGEEGGEVHVVAILGLRPERTGFSQIAVTAPLADLPHAARFRREPPFAPIMAGGDRAGFRSVVTEAELLHLVHIALLAAGR